MVDITSSASGCGCRHDGEKIQIGTYRSLESLSESFSSHVGKPVLSVKESAFKLLGNEDGCCKSSQISTTLIHRLGILNDSKLSEKNGIVSFPVDYFFSSLNLNYWVLADESMTELKELLLHPNQAVDEEIPNSYKKSYSRIVSRSNIFTGVQEVKSAIASKFLDKYVDDIYGGLIDAVKSKKSFFDVSDYLSAKYLKNSQ